MTRTKEVYKIKDGFNPYIWQDYNELFYTIPVSSGHTSLDYDFKISKDDLVKLKSSDFHFYALNYILFYEIQSTFGTGHPTPRVYTKEEFEEMKNKILSCNEKELKDYILCFSKKKNHGETYFETFTGFSFPK